MTNMNTEKKEQFAKAHEKEVYELLKQLARIPAPTGKEEKESGVLPGLAAQVCHRHGVSGFGRKCDLSD